MRYGLRHGGVLMIATALALGSLPARADHDRPGIFSDVGAPAAEDISHGNISTELMVDRCNNFLTNLRTDPEGHLTDYLHNYEAGFCIGWINASLAFLNLRDSTGAPALGVCLPEGIHTFDVVQTFLEFVEANPEDLKYNPSFVIYWAMLDKHPCNVETHSGQVPSSDKP